MSEFKEEAKSKIAELVKYYQEEIIDKNKSNSFSEADVGSKLVFPLLEALGWNTRNIDEVKEQEVTLSGPVDYCLSINKRSFLLLEIKKLNVTGGLDGHYIVRGKKESFAEQATRYGWHLKVEWVILTNFKEFRLYNSYAKKASDGLRTRLTYDQYVERFDELWQASKEFVSTGGLDKIEAKKERADIDEEVVVDLLVLRQSLTGDINEHNDLEPEKIKECVQKTIDRLIVIRYAEDKGIIGFESLYKDFEAWSSRGMNTKYMRNLKGLFRDFDEIYNTKLFESHYSEDITISNSVIQEIINILYKYNFDLISSDLLGTIYEDYLGHVLRISKDNVTIEESIRKRKEEGIYYTPTYIVEYLLENTLGKKLEGCEEPTEISKIKVLDPSCGSGAFLLGSFKIIKKWYKRYNSSRDKSDTISRHLEKITDIEHRILKDNLFGVELDEQAGEIASVNIMLEALKKHEKLPNILGYNIKIGNSLINHDQEIYNKIGFCFTRLIKPFDWQKEFGMNKNDNKFDIIIGNPPHGADLSPQERTFFGIKYTTNKSYKNTASMFIERSYELLSSNGILGLVIPKSLTYSESWKPVRDFILSNMKIIELIDLSKAFERVKLEQIVIIASKVKVDEDYDVVGTVLNKLGESTHYKVPISLFKQTDCFLIGLEPESMNIYYHIMKDSTNLGQISKTSRGLPIQSKLKEGTKGVPVLRGDNVKRYHYFDPVVSINKEQVDFQNEKIKTLLKPKVICQRLVAHVLNPVDHIIIMAALDTKGFLNADTVENVIIFDRDYDKEYVLCLLNSSFISWFTYKFIFNSAIRTMDFDNYYVSKIPIRKITDSDRKFFIDHATNIRELIQKYINLDTNYDRYFNMETQISTNFLRTITNTLDVQDKYFFDNKTKGKIKKINTNIEGEWLTVGVNYSNENDVEFPLQLFKIRLHNPEMLKFIQVCINKYEKQIPKGRMTEAILATVETPIYDKNEKENIEKISKMLNLYLSTINDKNDTYTKIQTENDLIESKIIGLFQLNKEQVEFIKSQSPLEIHLASKM